jgi:hypothetical protein
VAQSFLAIRRAPTLDSGNPLAEEMRRALNCDFKLSTFVADWQWETPQPHSQGHKRNSS